MIEITDAMLRAAVAAMDDNHIHGFSTPLDRERRTWGPPHIVRDDAAGKELWRGNSQTEMLERHRMEEMRLALRAALELVP